MSITVEQEHKKVEATPLMQGSQVHRGSALVLLVFFLVFISIPSIHQLVLEMRTTGQWRFLQLFAEPPTHESLKAFENNLASDSELAKRARNLYQGLLTSAMGVGNERIVIGNHKFMFFRKEVEMAYGPGFLSRKTITWKRGADDTNQSRNISSAPLPAIIDYNRQLRARGIHMVFVPLPVKPVIYPEELWPGYPLSAGPALNVDFAKFKSRLTAAGVDVLDLTDTLWEAKRQFEDGLFLRMDTHWTPAGQAIVADAIAAHVKPLLNVGPTHMYTTRNRWVANYGDLYKMLDFSPGGGPFTKQAVEIQQVMDGQRLAKADNSASVLLLGDSFSNIYRDKGMNWGEGAGLPEQVMLRLHTGVQAVVTDGGGASATRQQLCQQPDKLGQKKVVIWTCSSRDLFDEAISWNNVPLPEAKH